ncbi:hypothetical protein LCGC14_2542990 [marine sediment metagenome]|uniref:Uncharacterized protein n=1 Tax=marine sediment metagenome TaxID=412755 RepID=A0A0F9BD24_9ZZZZ
MRVANTPPIPVAGHRQIPPAKVLHTEDNWELLDATTGRYNTGRPGRGWQSVIKHHCSNINGSPYWMLLECHSTPTRCNYCNEEMPPSIVALFKLQNMEAMR